MKNIKPKIRRLIKYFLSKARIIHYYDMNEDIVHSIALGRGNISDLYPSDFTQREIELIESVRNYTMTSAERMVTLLRAIDYIAENNIQGDIVECGVWRGGSMMLIANRLNQLSCSKKKLFLLDTFEGMSKPSDKDVSLNGEKAEYLLEKEKNKSRDSNIWCYATLEDVKENISKTRYNPNNIRYLKGKVEETLPSNEICNIALLRLDTDWYESTKHELEHLWDKLVIGGILIIDDYGHWSGAKRAVDEFFEKRNQKVFLNRIDYTGRLLIKQN